LGIAVLTNLRLLKPDYIDKVLIHQLVRSATSVGANMMEASEAVSSKDFINKLGIVLKEAKESKYWLKLLSIKYGELSPLIKEVDEIIKVVFSIRRKFLNVLAP
jgi:four helix bundle protein